MPSELTSSAIACAQRIARGWAAKRREHSVAGGVNTPGPGTWQADDEIQPRTTNA